MALCHRRSGERDRLDWLTIKLKYISRTTLIQDSWGSRRIDHTDTVHISRGNVVRALTLTDFHWVVSVQIKLYVGNTIFSIIIFIQCCMKPCAGWALCIKPEGCDIKRLDSKVSAGYLSAQVQWASHTTAPSRPGFALALVNIWLWAQWTFWQILL